MGTPMVSVLEFRHHGLRHFHVVLAHQVDVEGCWGGRLSWGALPSCKRSHPAIIQQYLSGALFIIHLHKSKEITLNQGESRPVFWMISPNFFHIILAVTSQWRPYHLSRMPPPHLGWPHWLSALLAQPLRRPWALWRRVREWRMYPSCGNLNLWTSRNMVIDSEMEWNGMKWNEMEWNGMKWNEMEWNGMKWNEMEWNGMKWNEMECGRGLKCFTPFVLLYPFSLNRVDQQDAPLDLSQETRSSEGRAGAWCGSCAREGNFLGVKRVRNFRMFLKNAWESHEITSNSCFFAGWTWDSQKQKKTLGYHHVPITIAISVVGARRSACPSMARTASHSISFCLGATSATTRSAHSQHHTASGFL